MQQLQELTKLERRLAICTAPIFFQWQSQTIKQSFVQSLGAFQRRKNRIKIFLVRHFYTTCKNGEQEKFWLDGVQALLVLADNFKTEKITVTSDNNAKQLVPLQILTQ